MYRVQWSAQGKKDYKTAISAGYGAKMTEILTVVRRDPYEPMPGHHFEKLVGELKDHYSRRINYHNRFIYTVHPNTEGAKDKLGKPYQGIVRIHKSWEHKYKRQK
jgi:Txe/YoeB family toxin of toxin-antitoxin system